MNTELDELLAQLDAMTIERNAAVRALADQRNQFESEMQMLLEKQDRFVTELMDAHDKELSSLRAELEEAKDTVRRLGRKLESLRREAAVSNEADREPAGVDGPKRRSSGVMRRVDAPSAPLSPTGTQTGPGDSET